MLFKKSLKKIQFHEKKKSLLIIGLEFLKDAFFTYEFWTYTNAILNRFILTFFLNRFLLMSLCI